MIKSLLRNGGLLLFLMPLGVAAQSLSTTDKFTIVPEKDLVPGGEPVYLDFKLEGSQLYTAYNMEIALPQGVSVATDSNGEYDIAMIPGNVGGIYPYTSDRWGNVTHTHTFSFGMQENGNIRVACISLSNEDFTANSGFLFSVRVQASPYAKAGANEVRMTGLNLTTVENAQKYVPEGDLNTGTLNVSSEVSMPIDIKAANQYSTCLLPFAVASLPEGLQAFAPGTVAGNELPLVAVSSLAAYTPYILYAPAGYSGTLSGTMDESAYPDAASVTSNGLTGLLVQQQVNEGYILQNQGDGPRFYPVGDTPFVLPAGKCYLSVPAQSAVRLNFLHPTTSVETIKAKAENEIYYDLQGRRVARLRTGGVYLTNQRKIVINR